MKRPYLLVFSFFIFCLNIAFAAPPVALNAEQVPESQSITNSSSEKVSLQLVWKHQFEFAGFYAAIEKGFYRERGLQVELREYEPGLDIVAEVSSGKATFGLSNSSVIAERLKGKPVKLLANYFKRPPIVIVAKEGLRSLADLKGKRLMIDPKDLESPLFYRAFEAAGLEPGVNLEIVPHAYDPQPFINGEVDATAAFVTNELYSIENSGISFELIDVTRYLPALGDVYLFTSEQETGLHPERVKAFREASNQGWEYALQHPEEIIDLILDKYSTRKTREALVYEADKTRQQILPVAFPIGSAYYQRVAKVADVLVEQGVAADKKHLAGFLWDGEAQQTMSIGLTSEEKAWLAEKNVVRVRVSDSPPWEINTPVAQGMSVDYLRIIGDLFGINFQFIPARETWVEGFGDMAGERRHYDLLPAVKRTEARLSKLAMSENYLSSPWVIFTRKDDQAIRSLEDLRAKRVAVEEGYVIQGLLKTTMPEINLVTQSTTRDALLALSGGSVDAYVGNMIVADYLMQAQGIGNLKVAGLAPFGNHDQAMATRKAWAPLISIINKGLNAIPAEQHIAIRQKWLVSVRDGQQKPPFVLSKEEQDYLAEAEFVRGLTDEWMPLSFRDDNGHPVGIAEDYWQLIREKLELKESVLAVNTFSESLQRLKNGEADIYAGTTETADRKTFARFSNSYEQYPIAVATRKSVGFIANASILEGKVVAVGENYSAYHLLQERFPGVQFLQVRDTAAALSRVAAGEAYAAVDILPVLQYHIEQFPDASIKLSGVTDVQFPLQVMVSGQHERLVPLINRAIAAITDEERATIHEKWMLRDVVRATDYNLLWQVLFFSVTMLSLILYWNYRLRHEIRVRTQAERLLSDSESALLKAKEKAEAASETKTQFLTNISHELRTPMHTLISLEHLMRQTRLSAIQTDYLDKMQLSSRFLLGVIDDVLDASKIESGRIELNSVPFNPADVLCEVSGLCEVEASGKGLGFHVEIAENMPDCLIGDPQRLTQILLNLVGNAVKFTAQGEVCIKVRCMSPNKQQSCLIFSVKDTGPGISKAQQKQLFQRFSQLDSSLTRRHQGSGLGLAISQAFAQRMGGKIELDSEPGQGSTFTLTVDFPNCSAERPVRTPVTPEQIVAGSIHVLLVEDNALNQLLVGELLESVGVSVTVANNGAEAIEKLGQADFSAVLMDLQMPEMDGYEAARLIRAQPQWSALPIIAMTAHTAADEREKCLAAGMNDYLDKPFRPQQLVSMLLKWTDTE